MLNINGKLLDQLNANEYYLFSILLNYGKKSRPKNAVLCSKTGWGIEKVQRVKKSLQNKGILKIEARKNKERGGKDSNCYNITTPLASKYNGDQLHENQIHENQLFEIQIHENQILDFQIHDFQVLENQTDYKVLKLSIIENIKLLKEKCVLEKDTQIKNLKSQIESLKTELSEAQKEKEKSSDKKEKGLHQFPDNTGRKTYNPKDKRLNKQLPFNVVSARATIDALYPTWQDLEKEYNSVYSEKATKEIFEKCLKTFVKEGISRYYSGIRHIDQLTVKLLEWVRREVKFSRNDNQNDQLPNTSSLFLSGDLKGRNVWDK